MSLLSQFRFVAIAEGLSFILLLFIAMPLKYYWGYPLAVKITGMAHGILFILFCIYLYLIMEHYKLSLKTIAIGFISALLPFGTFFFDRHIRNTVQVDTNRN